MKKTITSAGLLVVGAASLHAQDATAPQLTAVQTSKPWSVSATLRGFYDDNYVTRPSVAAAPDFASKRNSFGIEISPSVGVNLLFPQTYLGLSYTYDLRYYEDRETDTADHSHQAKLQIKHEFTEQYKLDFTDSFVVAQEPGLIDPSNSLPLRTEGDNIRNTAAINLTAGLTERLSTVVGYSNTWYDYDQAGLSALLDRTEHLASLNIRWQAAPGTVGIVGYQYGVTEYDEEGVLGARIVSFAPLILDPIHSDIRDSRSHYAYVGVDHNINPQLSASLRLGAQFTQYPNVINAAVDDSNVSPYVDANLNWTYGPGSSLQLGVRHQRQATDIAFITADTPTLDQEATIIYGTLSHRLTARISGSLLAHYQHASFEGGGASDATEDLYLVGLNFSYQINEFLAAEAGYNFDRLESDIARRTFSRNRVYVGIRAAY